MSNKTPASRFVEVLMSLGIPAIGYLCVVEEVEWKSLIWQIPVLLLAAWHVICINDSAFGTSTTIKKCFLDKRNITGGVLAPIFILPAFILSPLFGVLVCLTIVNWDIYSLKGKRNWIAGLFHNFLGGALHFMIGVASAAKFANFENLLNFWPETLFFALTMTAGAMHHDSFDAEEDRKAEYITGAVKFSPARWWRLAVIPFATATASLCFSEKAFFKAFMISSITYFIVYTIISLRKNPTAFLPFRTICRLIFIIGAGIYLYIKFPPF